MCCTKSLGQKPEVKFQKNIGVRRSEFSKSFFIWWGGCSFPDLFPVIFSGPGRAKKNFHALQISTGDRLQIFTEQKKRKKRVLKIDRQMLRAFFPPHFFWIWFRIWFRIRFRRPGFLSFDPVLIVSILRIRTKKIFIGCMELFFFDRLTFDPQLLKKYFYFFLFFSCFSCFFCCIFAESKK